MIVTVAVRACIRSATGEVRPWNEQLRVGTRGKNLRHVVGTHECFKMPPKRAHVPNFSHTVFHQFVLHREIEALRIGRLVVEFDSAKAQGPAIYETWIHRNTCEAALKRGDAAVGILHRRPGVRWLEVEIELERIVV